MSAESGREGGGSRDGKACTTTAITALTPSCDWALVSSRRPSHGMPRTEPNAGADPEEGDCGLGRLTDRVTPPADERFARPNLLT